MYKTLFELSFLYVILESSRQNVVLVSCFSTVNVGCDYGFVLGLSISLTFLLSMAISLAILLVTCCLCVHKRKKEIMLTCHTSSYEFSTNSGGEGSLKALPNVAYREVQRKPSAQGHVIYEVPF